MPNSRPTIWEPPGTSELGKCGTLPPVLARRLLSLVVGSYVDDVF